MSGDMLESTQRPSSTWSTTEPYHLLIYRRHLAYKTCWRIKLKLPRLKSPSTSRNCKTKCAREPNHKRGSKRTLWGWTGFNPSIKPNWKPRTSRSAISRSKWCNFWTSSRSISKKMALKRTKHPSISARVARTSSVSHLSKTESLKKTTLAAPSKIYLKEFDAGFH